jgi:hypothetical protein
MLAQALGAAPVTLTTPRPPAEPSPSPRLNGWKEIAAHFGKGVRTVQRWEKELGLPIRRLQAGKGDIVYALEQELEAWRIAVERRGPLDGRPDEDDAEPERAAMAGPTPAPPSAAGGVRHRWRVAALVGVLPVASLCVLLWLAFRPIRQPIDARVDGQVLRAFAADGRVLWEHRFPFPLNDSPASGEQRRVVPTTIVDDVDGDGTNEVLFIRSHEQNATGAGLFCFEADGRLRFEHWTRRRVMFGDVPAVGPWNPFRFTTAADANGRKWIWLASNDTDQFPTVVEKIDPTGKSVGEFWATGLVTTMLPTTFGGRRVMVLAGANNEFNGASVAVVDEANPTGTAPAIKDHYVCRGCPAGRPIEFIAFPGSDVERANDGENGVPRVLRGEGGEFTVILTHVYTYTPQGRQAVIFEGATQYRFDAALRPLSGEHQPAFHQLHDAMHRAGLLDHPYGPVDDAALWPIFRWEGNQFVPVRPVASPAGTAPAPSNTSRRR